MNNLSDQSKDSKPEKPSSAPDAGLPNPFDFSSMGGLLNVRFSPVALIYFDKMLTFLSIFPLLEHILFFHPVTFTCLHKNLFVMYRIHL
jgi:hypothetical protein